MNPTPHEAGARSLFPDPPWHHNAPPTSRAAAISIKSKTPRLRAKVLDYITSRGAEGATDDEVQVALSMPGNTECPRRLELSKAGVIAPAGTHRRTRAGKLATVWIATSKGTTL